MEKRPSRNLIIGILVLAVVMLVAGGGLLYAGLSSSSDEGPTPTVTVSAVNMDTAVAQTVVAISQATAAAAASQPTQVAVVQPSPTLAQPPSVTPLATVPPTDTPVPTDTPIPTATATAVPPTAVPPTNPPPPPTNTPTAVPPTLTPTPSGPQPGSHNGLTATEFRLQDGRSNFVVNGDIWYQWTVANSTGADVPYSSIGVMPRKDGQDKPQWYQNNWGGPNTKMPPEGLSWPSNISVPEAGNYTIRLVVCFDGFETCKNGQGTYLTLSNEIPMTISP